MICTDLHACKRSLSSQLLHPQCVVSLEKCLQRWPPGEHFVDMSHGGEQRRGWAFTLNSESHSSTTPRSEPSIFLRDPPSAAWWTEKQQRTEGERGGGDIAAGKDNRDSERGRRHGWGQSRREAKQTVSWRKRTRRKQERRVSTNSMTWWRAISVLFQVWAHLPNNTSFKRFYNAFFLLNRQPFVCLQWGLRFSICKFICRDLKPTWDG